MIVGEVEKRNRINAHRDRGRENFKAKQRSQILQGEEIMSLGWGKGLSGIKGGTQVAVVTAEVEVTGEGRVWRALLKRCF